VIVSAIIRLFWGSCKPESTVFCFVFLIKKNTWKTLKGKRVKESQRRRFLLGNTMHR
jgi:hypothetical protein